MFSKILRCTLYGISLVTILAGCNKKVDLQLATTTGPNLVVYGLTNANQLVTFNASNPSTITATLPITISGLSSGSNTQVLSIDFRPATGELYGITASNVIVINPLTGVARAINASPFTPLIVGSVANMDFNPTVDRIRLVTNIGQNLRLNPETGMVAAVDGRINGSGTNIVSGVAYTNSRSGATSTILYDVDLTAGRLSQQTPPNDGLLVPVGSLNATFSGSGGFDISADNANALGVIYSDNTKTSLLYKIDLTTGALAKIGDFAVPVIDVAIPTEPTGYAVDAANNLLIFNIATPAPVSKPITGLPAGEKIAGIDFRPVNGQLYAFGAVSRRLFTINLGTGAATGVGAALSNTLVGSADFGFDFNPTVDRIRLIGNAGQNLRLNPNDGTIAATDLAINPGVPTVSAAAYTNNFAGATTTTLYVIDHTTDRLYIQNPPNNGTLVDVGALGVNITSANGFDIGGVSGKAYLIANNGTGNALYTINLTTGAATLVVAFPTTVNAFAVAPGF